MSAKRTIFDYSLTGSAVSSETAILRTKSHSVICRIITDTGIASYRYTVHNGILVNAKIYARLHIKKQSDIPVYRGKPLIPPIPVLTL